MYPVNIIELIVAYLSVPKSAYLVRRKIVRLDERGGAWTVPADIMGLTLLPCSCVRWHIISNLLLQNRERPLDCSGRSLCSVST